MDVRVRWLLVITLYVVGVVSINVFSPFQLDVFGKVFSLYGLPFSLDLVFVTGFFFILAYELNQQKYASLLESRWILVGSGALLVLFVWYFPYKIDFNIRQFDSLPINTMEALLGILFILSLSRRLERISVLSSMLSYVGQASLIILIFQVPI